MEKRFYDLRFYDLQVQTNTPAVKDGVFGAMMKVNLVIDGPVTMQLDSPLPRAASEMVEDGNE